MLVKPRGYRTLHVRVDEGCTRTHYHRLSVQEVARHRNGLTARLKASAVSDLGFRGLSRFYHNL